MAKSNFKNRASGRYEKIKAHDREAKLCPFCFLGRVDEDGNKPHMLNDRFKDCPHCAGTGIGQ